jgi:hypothetical protein
MQVRITPVDPFGVCCLFSFFTACQPLILPLFISHQTQIAG